MLSNRNYKGIPLSGSFPAAFVRKDGTRNGFEQIDQVPNSLFQEVFESVSTQLEGFRALAFVGLNGEIGEQVIADSTLNSDTLSEFATILRISQHICETTAAGQLTEMSWTADRWVVIARRVSAETFLILAGEPGLKVGFARYLLRGAAWDLRPQFEKDPGS